MTENQYPCLFYPTTVVFVDDNHRFIDELLFNIDLNSNVSKTFSQAEKALAWFLDSALAADIDECFSSVIEQDEHQPAKSNVSLDLTCLNSLINNRQNIHHPSVLVIDYDMPGMTGIELCKKIKNHPVKKVLITGQADHKIAVDAFNQGLIDRFILKGSDDFYSDLQSVIDDVNYVVFCLTI